MNEPDPINNSPNNEPDFQNLADAWIHLTPLQKKVILWRVYLESVRTRAARFVRSLLEHESIPPIDDQ